ncbi:MAG: SusC/RagA family TonB-linked outer membrane protein [Bacteroidales bacterium]|nr:SusC/RagA family TonB-linked outer membrane protein [Bacteroidales bacterium]
MKRLFLLIAFLWPLSLRSQTDTTSISTTGEHTVSREQMNKGLVTSGLGALSGQSAGVTVSGANQSAMLSAVRVRGTTSLTGGNDPLVIIDGVISDLSTLGSLYPGDIDSFTILKDASETAQYGSRGASGVIKVSTRRSRGGEFSISYDATGGIETVSDYLPMLSADGFRAWNRARGYTFEDHGFDSDMQSSILRTGWVQNHHIAFGGGSDDSHYRASIGILDHNAVVQTQKYENYSIKLDIGQKAFKILNVDMGVFASLQRNADLHDQQHLFYSAAAFNPTFRDEAEPDGSYCQIPSASQVNHPVSLLDKKYGSANAHLNVHLLAAASLSKDLTLNTFASYSYNGIDNEHFFPTTIWSGGEAYRESSTVRDLVGNLSLAYKKDIGEHRITANLMGEAQSTITSGFYTTTTGFTTNVFGLDAIQAGSDRPWKGTASYWNNVRMLSFMASANYSWKNTYVVAATLRADASSKFGKSHRWGWFPSVSASWVASNEPFLKDVKWLSKLKFNLGSGLSGNQGALGPYNSLQLVGPTGLVSYEGNAATSFGLLRNANPDLKWEVRSSVNAGMESSFWNNRIVFTAEYYYSLTRDMLYEYQVSVPPFAYSSLMANLGQMSNSGMEFGLGGTLYQDKDIQLILNMNLSFQRNRLISLSGEWQGEYLEAPEVQGINSMDGAGFHGGHNDVVSRIVGQPLGVFFMPHCTGLAKAENGTYYYETDGVNQICGQASPKAMLGSNISFRIRSFDVSMQVNGAFGHKIFNGTALTYMNMGSMPFYNVLSEAPEYNISDQTVTDYWLEDGDYINLDYITLGWNIPVRGAVRNLRVSLSVNNLATFTGYSGLTPMINSTVVNSTFGLDDKGSYPIYRSYTAAFSIQF